MSKIILLVAILLFVCWSIYNLYKTEGFQSPSGSPSGSPDHTRCIVLTNAYQSILTKYKKALNDKNETLIASLSVTVESMKGSLAGMGCDVPN